MVMALPRSPAVRARPFLRKVPEVIALFWVAKVLTTGMGEATSDFLVRAISPYVAVAIGGAGLVVALVLQFGWRRYNAWVYWLAVAMVAIAAGALRIVLQTEADNTPALCLYAESGYAAVEGSCSLTLPLRGRMA